MQAAVAVFVVAVGWREVGAQLAGAGNDEILLGGSKEHGDPGTIVAHKPSTGDTRHIYTPDRGGVFDFAVSPSSKLVRFVFEWRGLRILTMDGVQIAGPFPLVRRFVWSPDGRQVAYVVGRYQGLYAEDAEPSVWIWDSVDKRHWKIRDGAHHVSWARFDGNVYLLELEGGGAEQVLRFNPETRSVVKTTHRSIYFSPSGEYYYGDAGYGPKESVYLRRFDQPLKETSRTLSSLNGFRPIGWAPNADLLLLEGSRGRGRDATSVMMVYDPANDTSVDVPKEIVAWHNSSKELISVPEGGSVRVVRLSDFGAFR